MQELKKDHHWKGKINLFSQVLLKNIWKIIKLELEDEERQRKQNVLVDIIKGFMHFLTYRNIFISIGNMIHINLI